MLRILISLFLLYFSHIIFSETIKVEGLQKPAEIIVDTLGIPHIYAQEHYDAFLFKALMPLVTVFGKLMCGDAED